MKRVDFLGAPGTGKSTLYSQLVPRLDKSSNWYSLKDAEHIIVKDYLNSLNTRNSKEYLARLVINNYLLKPIHSKINSKLIKRIENDIIWKNRIKYVDFLNEVLSSISTQEKDPVNKLMGINWFYDVIKSVAIIENSNDVYNVIFDESLSQKVYGIAHYYGPKDKQKVEMYFKLMPKPKKLVYCHLTSDKILERVQHRSKTIPSHRELSETDLINKINNHIQISEIGYRVLKDRGVDVIKVNMMENSKTNVEKILHSLN